MAYRTPPPPRCNLERVFCRVEILKRPRDQVICAYYATGNIATNVEERAERMRLIQGGDGYRVYDMHSYQVRETWERALAFRRGDAD